MLKLNRLDQFLEQTENEIWDFPRILPIDDTVTKCDYITVYEDNHSNGDLANATEFSYTTDNLDIWLHPSESYLLVNLKLTDENGAFFPADTNISLESNGFNIFSEGRLFLGDEEVERIDHVGVSTMLYNLTQLTFSEVNVIREAQLVDITPSTNRDYIVKNCGGSIELLLPIRKIFPFYHEMRFAMRGMKHRICLTLNQQNKMVIKWAEGNVAAPANGKVTINKMVWRIPQVEPSLQTLAKLENLFARDSTYNMKWIAQSVLKFMPPKTSEIRVPIACSIHRPTHIFVTFQKIERDTDQTASSMQFDNMSVSEIWAEVNSQNFPNKPMTCNFTTKAVQEVYNAFLKACKGSLSWEESYLNFIKMFPFFHIDVSQHPAEIFDNSSFPNIIINTKFRAVPARDYIMYVIIFNIRELKMNVLNKRMIISK